MRPKFEDREKVKQRVNVSLHQRVKEKAAKIGDGNVSRGIEIAIKEFEKQMEGERNVATA